MTEFQLRIDAPIARDGSVRWTGELLAPGTSAIPLSFDFTCPSDAVPRASARPFLLAALVPAMRIGAPLRVPLPVDATTIANLMEVQETLAAWLPNRLRPVPIRSEQAPSPTPSGGALTVFSGGVDSCFTIVRHTTPPSEPAYRVAPLQAGLMVHGFDIGLDRVAEFDGAWKRSRALLQGFGLRAFRLRTNLRALEAVFGCDWGMETHGIWLAAALACYESWFDRVLIPSTYTYADLRLPWASNPVTDPLLGSDVVHLWHDGAAYSKLTKVRAIAAHEAVRRHLRVCWEGERLDRNCGRCFKCVATQVCFWLAGVETLPAFATPCSLDDVRRIPRETQNAPLLQWMCDEARSQGRKDLARALEPPAEGVAPAPRMAWMRRLLAR